MSIYDLEMDKVLEGIKPNVVTPKLREVTETWNDKKPRVIAEIIIRYMHSTLTNPTTKDIVHKGEIHRIRYFSIEPLLQGVWPQISLMILHLSYGEQVSIIEAIYPEKIQLTAKSFAINFTTDNQQPLNINVKDGEVLSRLDSANAGIATIIAILSGQGFKLPHLDKVKSAIGDMQSLVDTAKDIEAFTNATKRAQQTQKYNDKI